MLPRLNRLVIRPAAKVRRRHLRRCLLSHSRTHSSVKKQLLLLLFRRRSFGGKKVASSFKNGCPVS